MGVARTQHKDRPNFFFKYISLQSQGGAETCPRKQAKIWSNFFFFFAISIPRSRQQPDQQISLLQVDKLERKNKTSSTLIM